MSTLQYDTTRIKIYKCIDLFCLAGNQIVHEITLHGLYELRVNLGDFEGNKRFAKYSHFRIGNEADGYRLTVSGYTGNAGKRTAYSSYKNILN